ncbi:MAG: hypothetical protein ACP5GW_02920, partial [Caldisericaceae bacterium]
QLSEVEEAILKSLDNSSDTLETIAESLKMDPLRVLEILTVLEMKGLILRSGGRFIKSS